MTELMRRRRALMGRSTKTPRLPAEFQEVQWIGRTDDQPGIACDFGELGPLTMTIVVEHDSGIGLRAAFVGRSMWSSWVNDYRLFFDSNQTVSSLGDNVAIVSSTQSGNVHTVVLDIHTPKSTGLFKLFKINKSTNSFIGKIYSVLLERDGTIVADLVPCYRKADGEIGMYDIVSNTFFTNVGTGTFTKGGNA